MPNCHNTVKISTLRIFLLYQNSSRITQTIMISFNPTLHGLKDVAGDTENDPRSHVCGQIDL